MSIMTISQGVDTRLCGPWVQGNGGLSTHTRARYGNIHTEFHAEVLINVIGINDMIAHLKVGDRHIVIQKKVRVWSKLLLHNYYIMICSTIAIELYLLFAIQTAVMVSVKMIITLRHVNRAPLTVSVQSYTWLGHCYHCHYLCACPCCYCTDCFRGELMRVYL